MTRVISGRRWPAALVIAVSALAIGAVFADPHEGKATSAAVPANTGTPTITGTPQENSTLSANQGTWTGSPSSYAYSWSRCDENGGCCAAISGATNQSYQLKQVDAGTTLRMTVTATNSAGATPATSAPTTLVPGAPVFTPPPLPSGCPSGTGAVPVGDVSPPARLAIDGQTVTPGLVTMSASSIQVHVRVTACGNRPVQGALVYVTAVPYNQFTIPTEGTTGADGT